MSTVVCVLRSGGEYRPEHVQALRDGVRRWHPEVRFRCLSDVPVSGVETLPLLEPWPGWWAKLELFTPGMFAGRILYIDLDTVVMGDLSDLLAYDGPFAMLSDFFHPARPASGVMAWAADCKESLRIWRAFLRDPESAMKDRGGDQSFIRAVLGDEVVRLQHVAPGQIASYKADILRKKRTTPPPGTRLLCAHGKPKPWHPEWKVAA